MNIRRIHALFFSPAKATRTVVMHIAESIAALWPEVALEMHDFTLPSGRKEAPVIDEAELAIVGLPVYAGRLPNLLLNYLSSWKSKGALAVPVVVYGNRSYGNALIELRDILERAGFHSIAAAAFVGQHAFTSQLATGRPDRADLRQTQKFAAEIVERIGRADGQSFFPVEVPGQGAPDYGGYYKPLGADGQVVNFLKVKSVTTDSCYHCRLCVTSCPMGAIDPEHPALVPGICIKCNACIHVCPSGAKQFTDPAYLSHVRLLENRYTSRKEAEWF